MKPRSLADFSSECRSSGDELNYQHCPVCGSDGWNVYINARTGYWFCFAKKHGRGGRIDPADWSDAARLEMLAMLSGTYKMDYDWPEIAMPTWRSLSAMAESYLLRRGIDRGCIATLGLVELTGDSRILIPYRGPAGKIIHYVSRQYIDARVSKMNPKYDCAPGAKPMLMLPAWTPVRSAVLVEGPLDAIAVWQATGMPVISIGGTSLSKRIEHDIRALVQDNVHIMLDGDAHIKALELRTRLEDRYSPIIHLLNRYKDDPGSITHEELRGRLCA